MLVDKTASGLFRSDSTAGELSEELLQSYGRTIRWASQFQFYGMTSPRDVEEATIDLDIADVPRKFRRAGVPPGERLSESDLLASGRSVLVLGDPGAGKTTTVKRMVRAIVSSEDVAYPWPIVVVLRDVDASNSLVRLVGTQLGLTSEDDLKVADAGDTPAVPCQFRVKATVNERGSLRHGARLESDIKTR